jgi:hypothetical protein
MNLRVAPIVATVNFSGGSRSWRSGGTRRTGERGDWVKTKNRDYWRHGLGLEAIRSQHQGARS